MAPIDSKIDKMYDMLVNVAIEQGKITAHLEQNRKELDYHREELDILNEHKNNWIGKASVLASVIGSLVTGFLIWVTKHF